MEIASDVIAGICGTLTTDGREAVVVDAGDGKGYLSSHLALKYKLNVLGVDARPNNTQSAINRLEKLEVNKSIEWRRSARASEIIFVILSTFGHLSSIVETVGQCGTRRSSGASRHRCHQIR